MKTNKIAATVSALLITACSCDPVDMPANDGQGRFSLSLQPERVQVGVETRTDIETNTGEFLVYLQNAAGETLIDGKQKVQLTDADYNVQVADNYAISAESCTQQDATAANDGWGAPRFIGQTTFDVTAGHTTPVTLRCTLQNAGVTLDVQEGFIKKFPVYSITTEDSRSLVWNTETAGHIAYYNMDAETSELNIRIVGSQGGWEDRVNITKPVSLTRGKVNKVVLNYDDNSGDIDIDIDIDDKIDTEDNEAIIE